MSALLRRIQLPGVIAISMFIVVCVTVVTSAIPVVRALFDRSSLEETKLEASSDATVELSPLVEQIDGRSPFFVPDAPVPPPKPVVVQKEEPARPPPVIPPPSRYGGPAIVAMIDGKVWFDNGSRLEVGEEDGGVAVRRIDAPWSATVRWKDVEFDVPLFERDAIVTPKPKEPSPGAVTSQREADSPAGGGT